MRYLRFAIATFCLFFAGADAALAAGVYIVPKQGNYSRGDTVTADVKINSEGESINAAQAKISWSTSVLELVEVSKDGSVFQFWVEEPVAAVGANAVSFIGGIAKGISGGALQLLKLKFKAVGVGTANLSLSNAAVTASDGKGTNILSKVSGASYTVGGAESSAEPAKQEVTPEAKPEAKPEPPAVPAPSPPAKSEPPPAPQPVKVERKAVPALSLLPKPELRVPLYPDEARWHNHVGETVVFWNVPDSVIAAASALDHSPHTVPQATEKELATGKVFGALENGIWYLHVRFKNNVGWSPVAHYRIAIDTKPPLPFEVSVSGGETTDNPAPVFHWKASDALSGLKEYQLRIDDGEAITIPAVGFTGTYALPLQAPGAHRVVVRAIDEATNSVEDDVLLTILPIPTPTIAFVTRELFAEEEGGLTIKGTTLPNSNVLLRLERIIRRGSGAAITHDAAHLDENDIVVVAHGIAHVDEKGGWEKTFVEPFRNGRYRVHARSQDQRGAFSLVVDSPDIHVVSLPILRIGPLYLGKGSAALLLLVLLFGSFGGGAWFYKKRQGKLALRVGLAEAEVTKIFKLILNDAERLSKVSQGVTSADGVYALKQLQENMKKMESYLQKSLEKITR